MSEPQRLIQANIARHERIAAAYDQRHGEIYNVIEQERLREALAESLQLIDPAAQSPYVLDLGCGAGNLTDHLLALGCRVTAADVTPSFVAMVTGRQPDRVDGLLLNGSDLSNVADATYDAVATYSVLHHIPDYLATVREMARVVRPGGVVFIDHESASHVWEPTPALKAYRELTTSPRDLRWYLSRITSPSWWYTRVRRVFDPRYQEEGDIHVWPDDHIEWDAVERHLADAGCEIMVSRDYLLYEPHVDIAVYEAYRDRCATMHCCIARKRRSA